MVVVLPMAKSKPIIIFTDISLKYPALGYGSSDAGSAHVRDADDGWAITHALQDPSLKVDSILVSFGNAWSWLDSDNAPKRLQPNPKKDWLFPDQQIKWLRKVAKNLGQNNVEVEKGSSVQYQFDSNLSAGGQNIADSIRKKYSSANPVTLVGIGPATDILKVVQSLASTDDLDLIASITLELGLYKRFKAGPEIVGADGSLQIGDANMLNDIGAMGELLSLSTKPQINFVPFNSVRMGLVDPEEIYSLPKAGVNKLLAQGTYDWYFNQWSTTVVDQTGSQGFHFWDLVTMVSESHDSLFETVPVTAKVLGSTQYPGASGSLVLRDSKEEDTGLFVKRMPLEYMPSLVPLPQKDPTTQKLTFSQFDAGNEYGDPVLKQIALRAFYAPLDKKLQMSFYQGSSRLNGTSQQDVLIGYAEDDLLKGKRKKDILLGQSGRDRLFGDEGNDSLIGGMGDDILKGGPGADTFVLGAGVDLVRDFNPSEGDVLAVLDSATISYQQVGDDLNLILNGGMSTTILKGLQKDDFDQSRDLVEF